MRVETTVPLNDWRKVAEVARRAEEAGFDGIVSAEIQNDPFVPLAFAALATERIQLGTAIAVAFPRSPMVVANVGWDLHTQSGGRFVLGLGTQVKGHNERRFSVPWSAPAPRLREYVESLRAIWRTWQLGEPLAYEGRHYRFTLMTPEFSPPPNQLPPIPITIAAVGPAMMKLAGRICDGVRLHGFATRKYLEEVAIPQVSKGLAAAGRDRASFEFWGGGFIATGADAEAVQKQIDEVRYRIAFYGSTRSYHGVFAAHGWEDLGARLHRLSKEGRWDEMAREISDDVVRCFAAVGTYAEIGKAVEARFGGVTDSVALGFPGSTAAGLVREIVQDVRRIPCAFRGYPTTWREPS
jgi:probable F420-dependent oxidoreductase